MSLIRASRRCLFVAVGLLISTLSHAQQTASKDAAMAETLFEDGKRLMASGDYAAACPKLAESYRLDPGSGTLTALAACHEQIGKTASAWAEFIEVVSEAQRAGRADRERFARQRARALERGLSRLTISVAPETAQVTDVQVRRDDVVVGPAAWGVAAPVDPGDHVIEATAAGKRTWSTHVSIGTSGDRKTVVVPALEDSAAASSDTPPSDDSSPSRDSAAGLASAATSNKKEPPVETPTSETPSPAADGGSSQRIAGWAVGGAGAVSLVLGTYFGVEAVSKSHDAKQTCTPSNCTDPGAVQENSTAKSDALFADITLGAGLVAVGVGAYLLLSAPAAPSSAPSSTDIPQPAQSRLQLVPLVGRSVTGLAARAVW